MYKYVILRNEPNFLAGKFGVKYCWANGTEEKIWRKNWVRFPKRTQFWGYFETL